MNKIITHAFILMLCACSAAAALEEKQYHPPQYGQNTPFIHKDAGVYKSLLQLAKTAGTVESPRETRVTDKNFDFEYPPCFLSHNIRKQADLDKMKSYIVQAAPAFKPHLLDIWKIRLTPADTGDLLVAYIDGERLSKTDKLSDFYLSLWLFKQTGDSYKISFIGTFLAGHMKGIFSFGPGEQINCVFVEYRTCTECGAGSTMKIVSCNNPGFRPSFFEFKYRYDTENRWYDFFDFAIGAGSDYPCEESCTTKICTFTDTSTPAVIQFVKAIENEECHEPSEWYIFKCNNEGRCLVEKFPSTLPGQYVKFWKKGRKL